MWSDLEMQYNDKFDPEIQLDLEEKIADRIFNYEFAAGERVLEEEDATSLSKDILEMIIKDLRPDLVARKWIISDGNAAEYYKNWDLLLRAAENWYNYLSEDSEIDNDGMDIAVSDSDFSEILEDDLDSLNNAIRLWEERIAEAAGYTTFAGHGNYSVSAASSMGLNLTVREVEQ
jgi:hypothetical protein